MPKSVFNIHLLVVLFFLFGNFTRAQNPLDRNGKQIDFTVFKTHDDKITIQEILKNNYPFKPAKAHNEKTRPNEVYWLKIDLSNELKTIKTDSLWYIKLRNTIDYGTIYQSNNGKIYQKKIGRFENFLDEQSNIHSPGIPFYSNSLIQDKYIYLKIRRVTFFEPVNVWTVSYRSSFQESLIRNFYSYNDLKRISFAYIFAGICTIMFLFTLMFYFYSRNKEFLCYSVYVLALFLYLLSGVFRLHELLFGHYNIISYDFFQIMQVVINLSYILFVMYYLNTKRVYPKLHIALKIMTYLLIGVIILDSIFFYSSSFGAHIYLLDIERLIMTAFGLAGMGYLLFKGKNKLAYFIVIGSLSYMAGALGFLFLGNMFYMMGGASIEILIFAAGLTYKMQQEYLERLRFKKEAAEHKSKALRAQINPHFIFNSLSSIQSFITSNNRVLALKYLSKFSRLTRNILESSIETNVVLADEIKMLEDYLELESLRFEASFTYQLNVDETIDVNAVEIPFMILQPFVENAIIHGLLPKTEGKKEMSITFKKESTYVCCEIQDNGIGRQASKERQNINKEKKSRGLEVTKLRLQALDEEQQNDPIEIIDLVNDLGKPLGTKIIIKIPI